MNAMRKSGNSVVGSLWEDARTVLFTTEDMAERDGRVVLTGEGIRARREENMMQAAADEGRGVKGCQN